MWEAAGGTMAAVSVLRCDSRGPGSLGGSDRSLQHGRSGRRSPRAHGSSESSASTWAVSGAGRWDVIALHAPSARSSVIAHLARAWGSAILGKWRIGASKRRMSAIVTGERSLSSRGLPRRRVRWSSKPRGVPGEPGRADIGSCSTALRDFDARRSSGQRSAPCRARSSAVKTRGHRPLTPPAEIQVSRRRTSPELGW